MSGLAISVEIKGLDKALAKLEVLPERVAQHLSRAIAKVALFLEGESKMRTPVDTGRLRASIQTINSGNGLKATIQAATEYAVFVHEDLTARHTTGEAKYMERAVEQNKGAIEDIFIEEVSKATVE